MKNIYNKFIFAFITILLFISANAQTIKKDSIKIGSEAPIFVMRNIADNNTNVFLRDYTGKTLRNDFKNIKERYVVVLSFWATWCQPCKIEIPQLTKIAKEYENKNVKFFLINTLEKADQTEDSVLTTYNNRNYSLPCLIDRSCRVAGNYGIKKLPTLVVIDKFGIVRAINNGFHENFDIELKNLIDNLLNESAAIKKEQ